MLLAMYAWGIGKAGQRRMRRKLGTWIGITGFYIRRRRRITRNIASWKLNVKYVNVEWGNAIGQDIWWVGSICCGAVVEKLTMMWGVGKDEMKGRHGLLTTVYQSILWKWTMNPTINATSSLIKTSGLLSWRNLRSLEFLVRLPLRILQARHQGLNGTYKKFWISTSLDLVWIHKALFHKLWLVIAWLCKRETQMEGKSFGWRPGQLQLSVAFKVTQTYRQIMPNHK